MYNKYKGSAHSRHLKFQKDLLGYIPICYVIVDSGEFNALPHLLICHVLVRRSLN